MFSVDELIWLDFESASALNLKASGTIRYANDVSTRAIVLAYAIGNSSPFTWHSDGAILDWDHAPSHLRGAFARGATFAAWNASFDSAIWNFATLGFPFLEPERVIDPMIQAGVSNLPTGLESASRALGGAGKQKDGKKLIKLFCIEGKSPREYPEQWQQFLAYACQDIEAMRDGYRRTRPLPRAEWEQYWSFERVNRRGVMADVPFITRAAVLTAEDACASGRRLNELTGGAVTRVTQAKRLAAWLHDQLADAAMREVLTLGALVDDDSDDDDQAEPYELSLTRDRVARVLAMLEAKHANGGLNADEMKAREAATLRLYGAGAAPKKFARLAAQQVDGVLRDQYRFAGAGQTGRMSSKAAQIHNLTRDVIGGEDGAAEASLVDAIADGCSYAALAAASPVDVPVARKLALLVRPALIAASGKVFVWSDWSAIEARITPWLAASPDAERVLDIFRANDADPTRPDHYMVSAADILHKNNPTGISKSERQTGKVTILACTFGGSVGALQSMALVYRIQLDDDEARRIVDAWREANPWAPEFWGAHRNDESFGLWGAAMRAWEIPGQITTAGRIAFVYRADYLGGALFMALPSGRLLTYPRPRWRDVDVLGRDGKPTGEKRSELSFRRALGRAKLWHGTLCENSTQAVAADLLRLAVTRIETNPALAFMPIRMTTHDEIVCEVDEARAEEAKTILRREMLTLPDWAAGLPLHLEEIRVCLVHQIEGGTAMNAPFRARALWSHQERATTFLYERDAAQLIAPLGAGKCAAALTAAEELFRDGHRRHALVIAPKLVATTVWPSEVASWPHLAGLRVAVLEGSPERRRELLAAAPARDLTVIGVDLVPWLVAELAALPADHPLFDVLIIDETSRLKDPGGKRARALLQVAGRFRTRWGLTGTPRPNSARDLFMPAAIITNGALWGRSFWPWQKRHFRPCDPYGRKWAALPGAEERITAEFGTVAMTVADEDMPDLPPLNVVVTPLTLPDAVMAKYRTMARELFAEIEGRSIEAASPLIATGKLAQLANGFLYGEAGTDDPVHVHDLKIAWLRELVETLNGEPLLIAYEFVEDLRAIRRAFGAVPALGGPTPAREAAQLVTAWNAGELPLLAFHPASAGHGLNLQHGGSRMAWLSPSWSAELTEQAIARIYRPGQTRHVTIHVCVATRTVDEMKRNRVHGKMSAQEAFRQHLEQI